VSGVDGSRIKRALKLLEEFEAACEDQGIPLSRATMQGLIKHHRANAEVVGTFKTLTECGAAGHFDKRPE
jgi:hypothetical protein